MSEGIWKVKKDNESFNYENKQVKYMGKCTIIGGTMASN